MGNKKTCIDKKVVVDPHNGVVFYDDSSCKIRKYHNKGFKNIYSVVVKYRVPTPAKYRVFRMDYGDFHLAQSRFFIETNSQARRPSRMDIREVNLLVSTFKGSKLLYEDNIRKVDYGSPRIKSKFKPNAMVGEEIRYYPPAGGNMICYSTSEME